MSGPQQTTPKSSAMKKRPLTLKEKEWILNEQAKGVKPKMIAASLGRPAQTIYTVLKQRSKIEEAIVNADSNLDRQQG